MDENSKIDVYCDNIKTVKVIDFEKLKEEASKLKKISDEYKKSKNFNIFDIVILVIIILIFFLKGEIDNTFFSLLIGVFTAILVLGYIFKSFINYQTILSKRKKHFPIGTPEEIIKNINSNLTTQEIEKLIYVNYILKLNHDLPSCIEYKILGPIKIEKKYKSYELGFNQSFLEVKRKNQEIEFLSNAYNMKANVIINYNSFKEYISYVYSTGIMEKNVKTEHDVEIIITGTAVQVIDENKKNEN